jgi:OmpA-OmpF porin, OOP family
VNLSLVFLLSSVLGSVAQAQDLETFDLAPDTSDSGGTLQLFNPSLGNAGAWYIGVGTTLAYNPVLISDVTEVGRQLVARLHGGATLTESLRVHVRLPYLLNASFPNRGDGENNRRSFGDASIGVTYSLLKSRNGALFAAIVPELFAPFGSYSNDDIYLGTGSVSAQVSLALGGRIGDFSWTLNGGGRWAEELEFEGQWFGNKVTGGVGGHWLANSSWLLGAEVTGSADMSSAISSLEKPVEAHVYSSYGRGSDMGVTLVAGLGLNDSYGAPTWRTGLVVSWRVPGLVDDRDGDGIFDFDDPCPSQVEDFDGFQDEDGCLDEDNDEDGMLDAEDQCRNDAEDLDGIMDSDGCPEDDGDNDGVLDLIDECPEEAGTAQAEGCPDRDEDGVMDSIDRCIDEPGLARDRGCPVEELEVAE